MADHLRDATKKVDFILRNDAVQCAKDLSVDLLNDGLDSASYGAQAVAEWLKDIPTADVVEVVRCRDCIYYNTTGCAVGFGWCEEPTVSNGVDDNYYCAGGVRRNDK